MNRKEIEKRFLNQKVRLVFKRTGFVLDGVIDEVFEDCIAFRTVTKSSLIDIDQISELSEVTKND